MSFLFANSHTLGAKRSSDANERGVFTRRPLEASAVGEAFNGLFVGAPLGALHGASQAWWFGYPMGEGLLRIGKHAGIGGALVGVYASATVAAAQFRHKDDAINSAVGGFASGLLVGAKGGTVGKLVFFSLSFAGIGAWGRLFGDEYRKAQTHSVYELKKDKAPIYVGNQSSIYDERWKAIQERGEDK